MSNKSVAIVHIAPVIPITSAKKAEPEPRRATRKRSKRRVEQLVVRCVKGHPDLQGLVGVLTLDYVNGQPHDATFDPDDDEVPNVIVPVATLARTGADTIVIELTSEDEEPESWSFEEEDEEEDDE
jgi:hypothetical protein